MSWTIYPTRNLKKDKEKQKWVDGKKRNIRNRQHLPDI